MNFALAEVPLPLRFRPEQPMTDAELLRFCAANDVLRVERDATGEILVMTPAGSRTGKRNVSLLQALGTWADQDGRGYAFDSNTGFILPDGSMRSPDAAWIEAGRWEALSDEDKDRFSPLCPEFIVELRSPSDKLADLRAKMEQWMANGALLAWLIDPAEQNVTIYRVGQPMEHLAQPAVVHGDGPIAGFDLRMAKFWC